MAVPLQDDLEFVSYQGDGPAGPQYSINMGHFLNDMRLKQLEAAARNKCAPRGLTSETCGLSLQVERRNASAQPDLPTRLGRAGEALFLVPSCQRGQERE